MSSISKFRQFPDNFNLIENEEQVLKFFDEMHIYEKQIEKNKNGKPFKFLDGPPFCSGVLHIGHLLISACKSVMLNYMSLNGFNVSNKIGFDVHGIPAESMVNKLLNLKTRQDVIKYGIANYNSYCKNTINSLANSWEPIFKRIGRFIDYRNQYKTMDTNYMETCWFVFNELWKLGLIYEGYKVLHFSTGLNTPLSKQEATQNYKEVVDPSIFVKFKVIGDDDLYFVIWTTTPWTLPSNLAICVNKNLDYCIVRDHQSGHRYIVGKDALENLYPTPKKKDYVKPYDIIETNIKGSSLIGKTYQPPFSYFTNDRDFKVISADFVTSQSGTGIVHLAPAFGTDDFNACVENGIVTPKNVGQFCPIDEEGKFTPNINKYAGIYFGDANKTIIKDLKEMGSCIKVMEYRHTYPFCYRTNTPLIYMAYKSYFIDVPKLREQMVVNNKKTNWIPENVGKGQSHNWLENADAWCISRSRFWGLAMPVFQSDDGEEKICFGSIAEFAELAGLSEKPTDIHSEHIMNVQIPSKQGKGMLKWVGDTIDCWFESGCVFLAQLHYPFENKDVFDNQDTISDFVCEASEQSTNWFYVLNVISSALFKKPAFSNVIATGLILAADGTKISKSKGNFVDPTELFNQYGCDALRLYLTSSTAAHGVALKFNIDDVSDISKRLNQLYNVYKFFLEHVIMFNTEGNTFSPNDYQKSNNVMDKWILARVSELTGKIKRYMDAFIIYKPYHEINIFIEDVANWYVKFNRIRMKGRNISKDEQGACLSTCWNVLITLSKLLAPFAPFISETFYQYMRCLLPENEQCESVHLCDFPNENQYSRDIDIERKMSRLQHVAGIVRNLRATSKRHTSIKMPIDNITVFANDEEYINDIKMVQQLLIEDSNCFTINYAMLEGLVSYSVKPDPKLIGQRFRDKANDIKRSISQLTYNDIQPFIDGKTDKLLITIDSVTYELEKDCVTPVVNLNYKPKDDEMAKLDNGVLVIGNFGHTDKIIKNYTKSLFIRAVQDMRKGTKLHSWNKIGIYYKTDNKYLLELLNEFHNEISQNLQYEIKDIISKPMEEQVIVHKDCMINDSHVEITITDATGEFLQTHNE